MWPKVFILFELVEGCVETENLKDYEKNSVANNCQGICAGGNTLTFQCLCAAYTSAKTYLYNTGDIINGEPKV